MAPSATDGNRVKAQLATTRATLATAGIPLPWLDAEILVAHVLQSSRERLHSHPDRQLTVAQRVRLRRVAGRPAARRPGPHPGGGRGVYRHQFKVSPAGALPPPPRARLVGAAVR